MSKNKLAAIIIVCAIVVVAAIVLVSFRPWERAYTLDCRPYTGLKVALLIEAVLI
jgi:hypothetical protein